MTVEELVRLIKDARDENIIDDFCYALEAFKKITDNKALIGEIDKWLSILDE